MTANLSVGTLKSIFACTGDKEFMCLVQLQIQELLKFLGFFKVKLKCSGLTMTYITDLGQGLGCFGEEWEVYTLKKATVECVLSPRLCLLWFIDLFVLWFIARYLFMFFFFIE